MPMGFRAGGTGGRVPERSAVETDPRRIEDESSPCQHDVAAELQAQRSCIIEGGI